MTLAAAWAHYPTSGPGLDRWMEYAPHYEAHLPKPGNHTSVRLLELGVQSGGSAMAWASYYGRSLQRYAGVDIDPRCKRTEAPHRRIFVEIGSQLDGGFLRRVCRKHGPFDVVIDDGGHTGRMMRASIRAILGAGRLCMRASSVYAIEDMHTMTLCKEGYCKDPSDIHELMAQAFFGMHNHWNRDWHLGSNGSRPYGPRWAEQLTAVHLYDSLAILIFQERTAKQMRMHKLRRGVFDFENKERQLNRLGEYRHAARSSKRSGLIASAWELGDRVRRTASRLMRLRLVVASSADALPSFEVPHQTSPVGS